jgi:hypothetical protein
MAGRLSPTWLMSADVPFGHLANPYHRTSLNSADGYLDYWFYGLKGDKCPARAPAAPAEWDTHTCRSGHARRVYDP